MRIYKHVHREITVLKVESNTKLIKQSINSNITKVNHGNIKWNNPKMAGQSSKESINSKIKKKIDKN